MRSRFVVAIACGALALACNHDHLAESVGEGASATAAPPPENAGAPCSVDADCDSGTCILDPAGAYCAGTDHGCGCDVYGPGWMRAHVRHAEECGDTLVAACVQRAAPSACSADDDCASGMCLRGGSLGDGFCLSSCAEPSALTERAPHLCPIDPNAPHVGATTCAAADDGAAYCLPDSDGPLDVALFGAVASASSTPTQDAGPAIAKALRSAEIDPQPREVCLHAGTYLVDRTLEIGDHTTLFGQGGTATTLLRGNRADYSAEYVWSEEKGCVPGAKLTKALLSNSGYNCKNEGIVLRDFGYDGRLVEPEYGASSNNLYPMVAIGLSSVKDARIDGLHLVNAPQDVIFVRNGGVNVEIVNTTIIGFNERWFNGAAINVEMLPNGNPSPYGDDDEHVGNLRVAGNRIVARGPLRYCSGARAHDCETTADCDLGATCSVPAVEVDLVNIKVTSFYLSDLDTADPEVDFSGKFFPNPTIEDNVLLVGASGPEAVVCLGCRDTTVRNNCIAPFDRTEGFTSARMACEACLTDPASCIGPEPVDGVSFGGVVLHNPAAFHYMSPPLGNMRVSNNRLVGRGSGRGIVVQSDNIGASDVTVEGNVIDRWHLYAGPSNPGSIHTLGYEHVAVNHNIIQGTCHSVDRACAADPQCLEAACPPGDGAAIIVHGPGTMASGAEIRGNVVRDKWIKTFNPGLMVGAIWVRHYNQVDVGGRHAFRLVDNLVECVGNDTALVIGRGGGLPETSLGLVSGNAVVMTSEGATTCHPFIDESVQTEIACFWGCGHRFVSNTFAQPELCSYRCGG